MTLSWTHGIQVTPDLEPLPEAEYELYGKFALPMRPIFTSSKPWFIEAEYASWACMQIPYFT